MPTYNNKVVLRDGTVVLDVTPTTAVESDVASGKIFVKADGSLATGTSSGGGGTTYVLEEHTVTSSQWSSSYPYYYLVYLDDGVVDGETYTVSWDGVDYQMLATYDDMEEEMHIGSSDDPVYFIFYGDTAGSAGYAHCKTKADHTFSISYSGSAINLQQKDVNYIPTESYILDNITPSTGYQGLSEVNVTVDAIPSNYVGSGITRRSSSDLSASGATVSVPAGYYASAASKAVASGTAGTPTATKGAVSNHAVSVTPSVTNAAGYISGGTKTGTGVSVTAAELVSGSETKTQNGTYNVTNLASLVVNVPSGGISKTVAADAYTFDIEDDDGSKLVAYGLNEANAVMDLGNTYKVTYNNTEYTCVAGTSSSGDVGVGSLTYSFTDYPFFITTYQGGGGGISGWWAVKRGSGGIGYKTIKVEEVEEGFFTAETLNVSANGTYNAPAGKVYDSVVVAVPSPTYSTIRTGSTAPSSSLGVNGDVYIQV